MIYSSLLRKGISFYTVRKINNMQKTIFQCDQCGTDTTKAGKHVSIRFSQNSGIALPPNTSENHGKHWVIKDELNGKFVHFCDEKCVASWFKKLLSTKAK